MAKQALRTAPLDTDKMPTGMGHILTNEAAERFAYYGMSSILVVFMTQYLMGSDGQLAVMSGGQAKKWFHIFTAAVYLTPVLGAFIADLWWGKFRTIVIFSVVYCFGLLWLTLDQTRIGLTGGLILIALGSGIIKPCVSANVGDQFCQKNKSLMQKMFSWFYFAINLGAAISMYKCPEWLEAHGPQVGFGIPAALMGFATIVFWLGKKRYVHLPASGTGSLKEIFNRDALKPVGRLCGVYLLVSMFFALFYQSQSAWVLQAENMNLHWAGRDWLPAQVQSVNSIFILVMVPLFSYIAYPVISKVFPLTDLRKIGLGMFVTAACFSISIWIELQIAKGMAPNIGWQIFAYVLLTAAEIMVSVTVLEFSYTQAPKKLKSLIMSLYLVSIALGNVWAAIVNFFIENDDGSTKLPGASYYIFFTVAIIITGLVFIPVAKRYPMQEYIQDSAGEDQE